MAYLNEIQVRGEIKNTRQIMEYLFQLEDQIRYALQNLDGENIQAGAIGENLLSGSVQDQIKAAQRTASAATAASASAAAQVTRLNDSAARKLAGSGQFSLYMGSEKPAEHSVVWIVPGADMGDGTMACTMKYIS